jgi:hypothetical protein
VLRTHTQAALLEQMQECSTAKEEAQRVHQLAEAKLQTLQVGWHVRYTGLHSQWLQRCSSDCVTRRHGCIHLTHPSIHLPWMLKAVGAKGRHS